MGQNQRDNERIRKQEEHDFNTTKMILERIYNNYTPTFTPTPEFSPSDMRYTVEGKSGNTYFYNVEIKSRNQDMEKWHTLPLKEAKYQRLIQDTKEGEKLLYVALVNDYEYYIFSLSNIDFSKIEKRNWKIKVQEYNVGGSDYIEVPTYFIPTELAVNNGLIYN